MSDNEQLVPKLAALARLKLSAAEEAEFSRQLPDILHYVDQLRSVDVGLAAGQNGSSAPLRVDEAVPSAIEDDILERAPERTDRFWKVPPVK